MKRWRVLISAPYFHSVLDEYRAELESKGAELVVPRVTERLSEKELLDIVGEVDGVIAGDDQFTEKVLVKASPRLKVISKWGTGIDAFDLHACARLGIAVKNTPGAFTNPVADSVMGYVLAFARQLSCMDQQMKAGTWRKIPGRSLSESILGIIGFGNVGQAVARRAKSFGTQVLANDIVQIDDDVVAETAVQMVSKGELFRSSDFVSLNCDLNNTSRHLVDEQTFNLMKSSAVLINTARGPIVSEPALVAALESGQIAGAALDVFEEEPLPEESPLRGMPNVLLAPHNSNSSPAAWEAVHKNSIKNLFEVLEGGT